MVSLKVQNVVIGASVKSSKILNSWDFLHLSSQKVSW